MGLVTLVDVIDQVPRCPKYSCLNITLLWKSQVLCLGLSRVTTR